MRILVRTPNWVGDQIMAFPFFAHLRQKFPRDHIAVACLPWVEGVQFEGLVDQVLVLKKGPGPVQTLLQQGRFLKKNGPWDLGFILTPSFSSAWSVWQARVKRRIGVASDGRSLLLTTRILAQSGEHRTEEYLRILKGGLKTGELPSERIEFDLLKNWPLSGEGNRVQDLAHQLFIILCPGSMAESRRWAPEQWIELGRRFLSKKGPRIFVCGAPSEAVLCESISREISSDPCRAESLAGKISIRETAHLMARAQGVFCNDSGLGHMAALVGAPTLVIWGAGDPQKTRPKVWTRGGRALEQPDPVDWARVEVECAPCEKNICKLEGESRLQCLKKISVDLVWKKAQNLCKS